MNYRGYSERDLVSNRSFLLLYGSTETERRLWAEDAARHFEAEGPLRVATSAEELLAALTTSRGVVFVPDASLLGDDAQRQLVWTLHGLNERPKVVLGLGGSPDSQRDAGKLRNELHYALQHARVNLDDTATRDAARARRAKAAAKAKSAPQKSSAQKSSAQRSSPQRASSQKSRPKPARAAARAKAKPAARKPAARKPAAKARPSAKHRPAARKGAAKPKSKAVAKARKPAPKKALKKASAKRRR